jgi:hypothetical protein
MVPINDVAGILAAGASNQKSYEFKKITGIEFLFIYILGINSRSDNAEGITKAK